MKRNKTNPQSLSTASMFAGLIFALTLIMGSLYLWNINNKIKQDAWKKSDEVHQTQNIEKLRFMYDAEVKFSKSLQDEYTDFIMFISICSVVNLFLFGFLIFDFYKRKQKPNQGMDFTGKTPVD